jgi:hypothetical protein
MEKSKKKKVFTSSYTGVYFNNRSKLYESSFAYKGIRYSCGSYETAHLAVRARDKRILSEGFDIPRQVLFAISEKK